MSRMNSSNGPLDASGGGDGGERVRSKPTLRSGGTGGHSNVIFGDDISSSDADRGQATTGNRANRSTGTGGGSSSVFGDEEPYDTTSCTPKPTLRSGGTGGRSSIPFGDEPELKSTHTTTTRSGTSQSPITLDNESPHSPKQQKTSSRVLRPGGTGGDSSISFGSDGKDDKDNTTVQKSGRKLRGEDSNASSIQFGNDHDSTSRSTSHHSATTSSRVHSSGNHNDSSNVAPDNDKLAQKMGNLSLADDKKYHTSSRVLRPGGTGGSSNVTFGDDSLDDPRSNSNRDGSDNNSSNPRPTKGSIAGRGAVRDPNFSQFQMGDNSNKSNTSNSDYKNGSRYEEQPSPTRAQKPSSRVTKPPGGSSNFSLY